MTDPVATGGQAGADSTGTTATAPTGSNGASVSNGQTTGNGPDAGAIESFFDPTSIQGKPELEAAYKQMQSSYTKKATEIAKERQKIEAYNRAIQDPVATARQLAAQYGYDIVQRSGKEPQDWNPQSWDDVMARAKDEVRKDFEPVFNEVKQLKQKNIEGYLDSHYADWRTYEDDMMRTLQSHPSLVGDPDALYRLAVPSDVWEAKATAKAMQKLRGTSDNAQVSGPSSTNKQTTQAPTGPLTFDQAVQAARSALAKQGLRRPAD